MHLILIDRWVDAALCVTASANCMHGKRLSSYSFFLNFILGKALLPCNQPALNFQELYYRPFTGPIPNNIVSVIQGFIYPIINIEINVSYCFPVEYRHLEKTL